MGRSFRTAAAAAWIGVAVVALLPPTPAGADEIRDQQWHLGYLNVARAHELSQGEGITVAVIDTGVDGNHQDLAGNVLPGSDPWAIVNGLEPGDGWSDLDGHGTGMAGLIAAHGHGPGNADGALGIAPRAQIIPITVQQGLDPDPGSLDTAAAELFHESHFLAVQEAVDRGADIISIAQGAVTNEHIQPALDAGKIVIVAGGNQPGDHYVNAPPDAVGVGAVRSDGLIADVSTRSQQPPPPLEELGVNMGGVLGYISLTAPGQDIVSSSYSGGYRIGTGTSPSTSIVAGAAALVWSLHPELTGDQVIHHLLETSTDKGAPGPDVEYGYGDLDLVRALETAPSPPTTTTTPTVDPEFGGPVDVPDGQETAADVAGDHTDAALPGLIVALGGAAVAVAGSSGALVQRRRLRLAPATPPLAGARSPIGPAAAWPPPLASAPSSVPRRVPRLLVLVAAAGLVCAAAGGGWAATRDDGGSSDVPDVPGVGESTAPPTAGAPELAEMASACHEGDMVACDALFDEMLTLDTNTEGYGAYFDYGMSCGGRFDDDLAHSCALEIGD